MGMIRIKTFIKIGMKRLTSIIVVLFKSAVAAAHIIFGGKAASLLI